MKSGRRTSLLNFLGILVLLAGSRCYGLCKPGNALGLSPEQNLESREWQTYGKKYDEYAGIPAFANRSEGKGGAYQCTELAHRFAKEIFGVPTRLGMGLGNANTVLRGIYDKFGSKDYYSPFFKKRICITIHGNGQSKYPATEGSLISLDFGKFGHVAVVRRVEKISADSIKLILFEQHGERPFWAGQKKPLTRVKMSRNKGGQWSGKKVIDWLNFQEAPIAK